MSRNTLLTITPFHPTTSRQGSAPSVTPRNRPSGRALSWRPATTDKQSQPSWEELLGRR